MEAHASLQPLNLASELFAVVDVLDHNGTLRRAVTDSSRDAAARQGIANTVFGGKISSQAMAVLTNAVTQRWSDDADLATPGACSSARRDRIGSVSRWRGCPGRGTQRTTHLCAYR